jgi:hypothetical protein
MSIVAAAAPSMPVVVREFDYVDESKVSDKLKCAICLSPLYDPVGFPLPCKHHYCHSCITNAIKHAGGQLPCPKCAQPLTIESMKSEVALAGLADEIQVYCTHKARGCAWHGERGGVDARRGFVRVSSLSPRCCRVHLARSDVSSGRACGRCVSLFAVQGVA